MPGSAMTGEAILAHLAQNISERAAVPKEIFVIDKMPLTSIGKPMKNLLRQETAERTFHAIFAQATGLGEQIDVTLQESALHGTLLKIVLRCDEAGKDKAAEQIKAAMGSFATAYEMTWNAEATPR
jgi:fatty-acyl-CoA synthase